MQALLDSLRPTEGQRILDLVEQAGVDVRPWSESKLTGRAIDNPYTNTYRNSQWTFGGGTNPLVACIWWTELDIKDGQIVLEGNSKGNAIDMGNRLATLRKTGESGNRLRPKITKAQAFDQLVSEAYRRRKPVRAVVLDGERASIEQAEYESSSASKRKLDDAPWYVHSYDPYSGEYRLLRNLPMPEIAQQDPFDDAEDPGEDPAFQQWLDESPLSETEKEALLKVRVGQGWFRQALINRWAGCAVTNCKDTSLLLASHIKPWSLCTTRAERLSPANGLLLTPNLDKAFDRGLISFDESFKVMLSPKLNWGNADSLKIDKNVQLRVRTFDDMKPFMKWHREELFNK